MGILCHLKEITLINISLQRIPVRKNRINALIIHYVLKAGFLFYRLFRLNSSHKQKELPIGRIRKILIVRIDGLGDIVMSTPAFRALRNIFCDSYITLLSANWSKALVEVMPIFDEIIYFDAPWLVKRKRKKIRRIVGIIRKLRKENFDLFIDLRGDFRNNILMFFCKAKYRVGFHITGCHFLLTHVVPCDENHHPVKMALSLVEYLNQENKEKYKMSLWVKEEDRKATAELLRKEGTNDISGDKLVIVIHPAARWRGRQWTMEGYAEIADRLIEEYQAKVIFTGSPNEIKFTLDIANLMKNKSIVATGKTTLRQFLCLLERSHLFIGIDSGPMHMATAMGTKVIALFGAARSEAVGPYGKEHIVITKQDNFLCSPCAQVVCKRPNNSCMKAITADDVWNAVENQIKRTQSEKNK